MVKMKTASTMEYFRDILSAIHPWLKAPVEHQHQRSAAVTQFPTGKGKVLPSSAPSSIMAVSKPFQKPAPDAVSETRGN